MPVKDGPVKTICIVCEKVDPSHVTKSTVAEEFGKTPNALTRANGVLHNFTIFVK